jgi:hypothetical protein
MRTLELVMNRNWQVAARYATYFTKIPGGSVYLQIANKTMGRIRKTVPLQLKVTIEEKELPERCRNNE